MTTHPSDPGVSEEILAEVASQVAQQSRTLAPHVWRWEERADRPDRTTTHLET